MSERRSYNLLVTIAVLFGAATVAFMIYGYFADKQPGELAYHAGNTYFQDKQYQKAKASYLEALQENPNLAAAYSGLANTMVQTKQFDDALRFIEEAIELNPKFGGYYAIRGIIHDHSERYKQAMADYEKALLLYPDVKKGMGWIDRFFNKLEDAPPTVAERLSYLKAQMALPKEKRVLRVPGRDAKQIPYEQ